MDVNTIGIKIKIIEEKKIKAIISLVFDYFVVKGFRLSESEFTNSKGDKIWLTPPSYRDGGGKYHPIFFMPDKTLWQALELRILDEYEKQISEYHKKRFDLDSL